MSDNESVIDDQYSDPYSVRPASSALTKTGGFLADFSHTLQPYIGCRFGCSYCYVTGLMTHRFHRPSVPWGEYVHPRSGIDTLLRRELSRYAKRNTLSDVAIFMSSATDPYQAIEREWRLSRRCVEAMIDLPPRLLLLQTRSPFVADDFDRLQQLGQRVWLSVTLETDLDDVRRRLMPRAPSVDRRIALVEQARRAGLQVQLAVSPSLPYSSVATFSGLLADLADRVVVDSFVSGDGQGGRRTASTSTPELFEQAGYGNWRSEVAARRLHESLQRQIGDRVGWSRAGFNWLASSG